MNVSDFDRLKETTLKQTYHFRGRIINLRVDDVALSDGSRTIREVVEHPGGVCVAALTPDGRLPFVRQYSPEKKSVWNQPFFQTSVFYSAF